MLPRWLMYLHLPLAATDFAFLRVDVCLNLTPNRGEKSHTPLIHSGADPAEPEDMARCHRNRTHNSRLAWGAITRCNRDIRRRTGTPWSAWFQLFGARIRHRSRCFAIATRSWPDSVISHDDAGDGCPGNAHGCGSAAHGYARGCAVRGRSSRNRAYVDGVRRVRGGAYG